MTGTEIRRRAPAVAPLLLALAVAVVLLPGARAGGQATTAVSGGASASAGAWPWHAAIVKAPSKYGGNAYSNYLCGGTVVHPFIVLVAARCVDNTDPDDNTDLDPEDIRVVIGRTTLSGSGGTVHTVREVWPLAAGTPPGYDRRPYSAATGTNDYTYLTLDDPSPHPIKIVGPDERYLWLPGRTGWVTGYGATTEGGGTSDRLRVTKVYVTSDVSCKNKYGAAFYPASMVCAGFLPGSRGACDGDAGGPMASPALGGVHRLSGIVSFGRCGVRRTTDIYVRVGGDTIRNSIVRDLKFIEDYEGIPHFDVVGHRARLPYKCKGAPVTIAGTRAREVIKGTSGQDVIQALSGRDRIYGRRGNDVICGGPGGDLIVGNKGHDQLYGERGHDVLKGGFGIDACFGGPGRDAIRSC